MNRTSIKFAMVFALLSGVVSYSPAEAQEGKWLGAITYNMAVPTSSLGDFTGDFSPAGFGMELRYLMRPQYSMGMAFGWQMFDDETDDVVQLGNVAFQGDQFRWTNVIPILVNAHYYFRQLGPSILPFAGFGLGAYAVERRLDVGIYTLSESTWHFGIAPELGIAFRTGPVLPLLIFRYNHAFSSDNSGDQAYFNINVGLAWN